MPTTQDRPASHTNNIDRAGNHLQIHGNPAQHCAPNTLRRLGVPVGLQVMSRFEPSRDKAPTVLLNVADAPFTFDWRMTAAEARALAANLLHAADCVEAVAPIATKRAARKGAL